MANQLLKNLVLDSLAVGGLYPTKLTTAEEVGAVVRSLRPISPGIELRRLGPTGDGGYVVPDDLEGIEACFSPGIGGLSGFEHDCGELGMQIFLADNSVARPAESHRNFSFTKKHIGAISTDEFMTMDEWVSSSLPESTSDLLLQIDIEGYEYETLLSMSGNLLRRLRIIVAEFHSLDMLWSRPFYKLASRTFEKLLQTHTCVHLHPNNISSCVRKRGLEIPRIMEFTFLRNDRVLQSSPAELFPHPLDSENCDKPALPLPGCWYGPR